MSERYCFSPKRQIVRFDEQIAYKKCLDLYCAWQNRLPGLRQIRPLPLIHGFSIPAIPAIGKVPLGTDDGRWKASAATGDGASEARAAEATAWGEAADATDAATWGQTADATFSPYSSHIEADLPVTLNFIPGMLPVFSTSPASRESRHGIPSGIKQIEAHKAWKIGKGKQVKIGVIDTGADYHHPDLRNRLGEGVNFIYPYSAPFDDNGHGTHIAGTIVADGGKMGISGVAPRALVHPVKSFDRKGTAYVSDIIRGLEWCIRHKMDIINMSFGMQHRSMSLYEAIQNATQAGIIIVASSGNDGRKSSVDFPARFRQTISVGASSTGRSVTRFSNRGPGIDIFAPGDNIESTWIKGQYRKMSGTSMATAHVSGTLALMIGVNRRITPAQAKNIIRQSGRKVTGRKNAREVNALRAVRRAVSCKGRRSRKSQSTRNHSPRRSQTTNAQTHSPRPWTKTHSRRRRTRKHRQ